MVTQDIHVKLTSTRDPEDVRHLTLTPGTPCPIGRASKTKGEIHRASGTNGLFVSPVVSRSHAELRGHPWSPKGDQVTLVDYGSMHGTKVNDKPLERGRPMALRNGDVIKFGEKVTRGVGMDGNSSYMCKLPECADQMRTDIHDGVAVTFQRVSIPESQTLATSQAAGSRGYHGQYISDDDESDGANYDDSEDGWYSEDNEPHDATSAKTTPEQSKGEIGSQQNPIELETTGPHVIDLIDDEDARMSPPPSKHSSPKPIERETGPAKPVAETFSAHAAEDTSHPRIYDSQKVIFPSVDKANSVYDFYKLKSLGNLVGNPSRNTNMTDGSDSSIHKLGLAGVINNNDELSSVSSESEMSEGPEALEEDNEEDENEEEEQLDEDEHAYDDDESSADNDSLYEPDSYQLKKQPSPELGSDTGFITSPASAPPKPTYRPGVGADFATFSLKGLSASQPLPPRAPYDPVRSSGVSRAPEPATAFGLASHHMRYPFVGNGPWDTGAPLATFNAPSHIPLPPPRLNWSPPGRGGFIAPPPPPPPPPPGFMVQPPRSGGMSPHLAPPFPDRYGFAPLGGHVQHYDMRQPPPPPPIRTYGQNLVQRGYDEPPRDASAHHFYPECVLKIAEEPMQKEPKLKGSEKKKISIGELVEDDVFEDLWATGCPSAGTKRKADEISGEHDKEVQAVFRDSDVAVDEVLDAAREQPSEEPSSRRRRISTEDDVSTAVAAEPTKIADAQVAPPSGTAAGGAATLAGGVVLGSMATLAFLVSPLAEKALEWLV